MTKLIVCFLVFSSIYHTQAQKSHYYLHDIEHSTKQITWVSGAVWTTGSGMSTDYYIQKLEAGSVQKTFRLGGKGNDYLYDTALFPNGDILLLGDSNSEQNGVKTTKNLGGRDIWLVRMNSDGEILWQKSLGTAQDDWATTVKALPNGNMLVGGQQGERPFLSCVDGKGNILWEQNFERYSSKGKVMTITLNDSEVLVGIDDQNKSVFTVNTVNWMDGTCVYGSGAQGYIVDVIRGDKSVLRLSREEQIGVYEWIGDEQKMPLVLNNETPSAAAFWNDEYCIFTEQGTLIRIGDYGNVLSEENYTENYIVTSAAVHENGELWVTGIGKKDKVAWHATLTPISETKNKAITHQLQNLNLYPNPASDIVYLEWNGEAQITTIQVYNMAGKLLTETTIANQYNHSLDIDHYPSGMYVISVQNGENVMTQKLVIE